MTNRSIHENEMKTYTGALFAKVQGEIALRSYEAIISGFLECIQK